MCGYYSKEATNWGVVSIRINMVSRVYFRGEGPGGAFALPPWTLAFPTMTYGPPTKFAAMRLPLLSEILKQYRFKTKAKNKDQSTNIGTNFNVRCTK